MKTTAILALLLCSCNVALDGLGDAGVTITITQPDAGVPDGPAEVADDVPDPTPTMATTTPAPYVTGTHDAFGVVMRAGTDLLSIRRRGTTHAGDRGVIVQSRSTDDGATWSVPALLFEDPALDSRNVAGGARTTGELVVAWNTYYWDPPGQEQVYISRSTDNGTAWAAPVAVTGASVAYGPLIEAGGRYGFVAQFASGPAVVLWDDFGIRNVYPIVPAPATVEVAIVAVTADRWVGFAREDYTEPMLLVETLDGGLTWTVEATSIPLSTPPTGATLVSWWQVSPWLHRSPGWLTLVYGERCSYTPLQHVSTLRAVTMHESDLAMGEPVDLWVGPYLDFGYPSVTLGDPFALQFYSERLPGAQVADTYTATGWLESTP